MAFAAIFFFKLPFPAIVAAAALGGLFMQRIFPQVFCKSGFDFETRECRMEMPENTQITARPSLSHFLCVFFVCLCLWLAVVETTGLVFGFNSTLSQIALFFSKAAFVTFGGAYAVLSYITDVAVSSGWVTMQQMLIGLGLAESTPGPLIMVTQFVGFLGAWTLPGSLTPLTAGILGALITTYVTFLPSFFFIFAGAPFIEAMAGNQRLQAALTGVTAAVVGVVLNLAVWFGYKVILPNGGSPDLFALASAGGCLLLIQKIPHSHPVYGTAWCRSRRDPALGSSLNNREKEYDTIHDHHGGLLRQGRISQPVRGRPAEAGWPENGFSGRRPHRLDRKQRAGRRKPCSIRRQYKQKRQELNQ